MADLDLDDIERRMDGAVAALKTEFAGLRTGRASASLLEPIHVDAYGSMMPLNQVASISVPEPRMISVQVWDRSMSKAVERAIRDSGLGMNPQSDGQLIRVPLPDLSQERRAESVQVENKLAEGAGGAVSSVGRVG